MQKLGSVFMGSKGFFVNCTFHTLQRINEYNIEHRKILDMIRAAGPAIEHTSVDFLIRSQSAGFSVVVNKRVMWSGWACSPPIPRQ